MVFGSLAGIKEWLLITGTQNDTELTNLQTYVNRRISQILKRFCDPSTLTSDLVNELAEIENKWVAGVFRKRRSPPEEKNVLVEEAQEELNEFIDTHFKQGFFKTALKALKTVFGRERGAAVVVKL